MGRHFFGAAEKRPQGHARRFASRAVFGQLSDQDTQAVQAGVIEEPLLTIEEARHKLHLTSHWAVRRLIRRPKDSLPIRRLGRAIRIHQGELDQWTRRERQGDPQTFAVLRGGRS